MKRRSGFAVLGKLIGLMKPLTGYMLLAITMGLVGHLCAAFITLSGGERQRLGLARAFLHDAPFLLLDEPTSNLDSLNEAVILRSLREEGQGKTVVLVSHRASTMRIADNVYSVEHGRMS